MFLVEAADQDQLLLAQSLGMSSFIDESKLAVVFDMHCSHFTCCSKTRSASSLSDEVIVHGRVMSFLA